MPARTSHKISEAVPSTTADVPAAARPGVAEVQSQLPGMAAFLGDLQQHRELVVGVGRADVLDAQHAPAPLVHDLDRGRTRGGLHPPHEHAHPARLPTPPAVLVTTPEPTRRESTVSAPGFPINAVAPNRGRASRGGAVKMAAARRRPARGRCARRR